MDEVDEDLEKRFSRHFPDADRNILHREVTEECKLLAYTLKQRMPAGREASLSLNKLEETMFWANEAIARNELNAP